MNDQFRRLTCDRSQEKHRLYPSNCVEMDKRICVTFSPTHNYSYTNALLREREKRQNITMTTTTLLFGGTVFLRGVPSALTMRRGRQRAHSCSSCSSAASKAVFLPSSWRRNNINARCSIVARSGEKSSSSKNEKKKMQGWGLRPHTPLSQ